MSSSPSASSAPKRVWTTLDLLTWTKEYFAKKNVESPRLVAEMLLAEVMGCDRIRLYTGFEQPVGEAHLARFRELVKRRVEGREPLQYLLGHTEFLDLKLKVTPAVLIPRPETEELAQWAIAEAQAMPGESLQVLDLGTGSGCLALCVATKVPKARVTAIDTSPAALEVARENAAALKLSEQVTFVNGDLFGPLAPEQQATFDLILSNPPYIDPALKPTLAPEVLQHEPAAALFADEQGLAVSRRIVAGAGAWLKPLGRLGLEISPEQAGSVRKLLEATGVFTQIEIRQDARKQERFAYAVRL